MGSRRKIERTHRFPLVLRSWSGVSPFLVKFSDAMIFVWASVPSSARKARWKGTVLRRSCSFVSRWPSASGTKELKWCRTNLGPLSLAFLSLSLIPQYKLERITAVADDKLKQVENAYFKSAPQKQLISVRLKPGREPWHYDMYATRRSGAWRFYPQSSLAQSQGTVAVLPF